MVNAAIFHRVADLPFRKLDDEVVIVNPRERQIHVLNGTAAVLWDLLERSCSVPELVTAMIGEDPFDVGTDVVARDVAAFVGEMLQKGLVSVVEPAGTAG